jgi:hypothetical protein
MKRTRVWEKKAPGIVFYSIYFNLVLTYHSHQHHALREPRKKKHVM